MRLQSGIQERINLRSRIDLEFKTTPYIGESIQRPEGNAGGSPVLIEFLLRSVPHLLRKLPDEQEEECNSFAGVSRVCGPMIYLTYTDTELLYQLVMALSSYSLMECKLKLAFVVKSEIQVDNTR